MLLVIWNSFVSYDDISRMRIRRAFYLPSQKNNNNNNKNCASLIAAHFEPAQFVKKSIIVYKQVKSVAHPEPLVI